MMAGRAAGLLPPELERLLVKHDESLAQERATTEKLQKLQEQIVRIKWRVLAAYLNHLEKHGMAAEMVPGAHAQTPAMDTPAFSDNLELLEKGGAL
jgi:hypothetical protein